jgi:hypothetical protein
MSGPIPRISGKVAATSLAGLSLACLLGVGLWRAAEASSDRTPEQPSGKADGQPDTIQSIRPRLAYEAKHGKAAPKLTQETKDYLLNLDSLYQMDYRAVGNTLLRPVKQRAAAFRALHEKSVKQFVSAEGFGMERMITFIPEYLEVPEAPPIKLAQSESYSESEAGDPVKLPRNTQANPIRLPFVEGLMGFHMNSERNFTNLAGFAFVSRDGRDRKAPLKFAFRPHQFRHVPEVDGANPLVHGRLGRPVKAKAEKAPKEKWVVQRIELISLLKHKEPVAYITKHLPRMDDLRKAPTRGLDGFEMTGLKSLREGETLVSDASVNRVYLLGALRASKQCLNCHQVQHGALLGAFSYELWRNPPITEEKGG